MLTSCQNGHEHCFVYLFIAAAINGKKTLVGFEFCSLPYPLLLGKQGKEAHILCCYFNTTAPELDNIVILTRATKSWVALEVFSDRSAESDSSINFLIN